jgi:hypothetical protein
MSSIQGPSGNPPIRPSWNPDPDQQGNEDDIEVEPPEPDTHRETESNVPDEEHQKKLADLFKALGDKQDDSQQDKPKQDKE